MALTRLRGCDPCSPADDSASKLPGRQRWTSLPFTDTLEPVTTDRVTEMSCWFQRPPRATCGRSSSAHRLPSLVGSRVRSAPCRCLNVSNGAAGVMRGASPHHRRSVTRAHRPEIGLTARPITSRSEFLGASLTLTAAVAAGGWVRHPASPLLGPRVWELHEQDEGADNRGVPQ